jgi:xylulokinase
MRALRDAGGVPLEITVIGGGSRSGLWTRIVASSLGESLLVRERAELGPAFGAARLGRLAVTGEPIEQVCHAPPVLRRVEPVEALREPYRKRLETYRELYRRLRTLFAEDTAVDSA